MEILHVTKGVVMWLYIFVTAHGTVPPGTSSVKHLNLKVKPCGLMTPQGAQAVGTWLSRSTSWKNDLRGSGQDCTRLRPVIPLWGV